MQSYVDQSASALRFHLLKGTVDLRQFTVFCQQALRVCSCHVEARIIGASHILAFNLAGGIHLTEILSCTKVETNQPQVSSGPLGEIHSSVRSTVGSHEYTFVPRLVRLDEGADELERLARKVERAHALKDQIGLSHQFPQSDACRGHPPLTLVWGGTDGEDRLLVETAHSYPNEGNLVLTKTTVTMKGDSR